MRQSYPALVLCALLIFTGTAQGQNTVYTTPYNSGNFTKTIDLLRPVGETEGSAAVNGSGGATYSIPIFTSPGTNGLEPSISLAYSSQAAGGIAGFGWNVTGLSAISRMGKNIHNNGIVAPVKFTALDDAFVLDGKKLIPVTGSNGANGTVYAAEVENYDKIESITTGSANNPQSFKVTTKEGIVMEFGATTDSRFLTDDGLNVLLWQISRIIDANGNYMEFKYSATDRHPRITQILYTGNTNTGLLPYNQVNFTYSVRSDQSGLYEAGAKISSKYILDKIVIVHTNDASVTETVKTYKLSYGFDNVTSLLKEVTEYGGDETKPSLNSTIFLYGDAPANVTSFPTNVLNGQYDFYSGDFDADGKTDILEATRVVDPNLNTVLHTQYALLNNFGPMNGSTGVMYIKSLPQGSSIENFKQAKFFNFLTADYDKDGRDDVLHVKTSIVSINCGQYRRKIEGVEINHTKSHNNQTGWYDYTTANNPFPTDNLGYQYQYDAQNKGNFFFPGDFDGDGNQDYILLLGKLRQTGTCSVIKPLYDYDCKGFMNSPATGELNKEIVGFGIGTNPYATDFYSKTINDADNINVIDFDGDGKMELMVTKNLTTYIIAFTRISPASGYYFSASVIYTTTLINKDSWCYPGDFNGDRKADILIRNSNGVWNILYSNGLQFNSEAFSFSQTVAVYSGRIDDNHKVVVADFNGDGKSDILHGYNYWFSQNTLKSKLSMYYSRSVTGSPVSAFFYEQYDYNEMLGGSNLIVGDFNGDGRTDLMNNLGTGAGAYVDFVSIKQKGKERLLHKVTTGHGVTTSFAYKQLTDKDTYPYFYNRTTSLDAPANQNPYNFMQLPMYAVSSFTTPDGNGGDNITNYTYEDAVVNRAGKGFMGFKKVIAKNNVTGITSITENDYNSQFAAPYPKKQSNYLTSNNTLLSETNITNSFVDLTIGVINKRYFHKVDKTVSVDYVNASRATETVNTYDNYGNVTNAVTKTGYASGGTVTAVETANVTTTYILGTNTPVPSLPSSITTINTRSGAAAYSITKTLTYNGQNRVSTQTDFSGLPKAVTQTFTYNSFGNTISKTYSSSGLPSITTASVYDNKGRYVVETKSASGTSIEQIQTTVMNSKWGKPASVTSSDCLTTTVTYDDFGRVWQTTPSTGNTVTETFGWNIFAPNFLYYTLKHHAAGAPDTYTYFNKLNKETKTEKATLVSQGPKRHTTLTTYNAQGDIASKTNSYFPGLESARMTYFQYDVYGRAAGQTDYQGATTISYSALGNGVVKTTTTSPASQVFEKTTDPTDKIIASKDNGGELFFTYNSQGNQVEVKHGANTVVTSTFDDYGNQSALTETNAGTVTYTYDAYKRLSQQQDANGNITTIVYDDLNRVVTKTIPEGTISYTYFSQPFTNCRNNNVKTVTNYNGILRTLSYDHTTKRLQSVTQTGTNDGLTHTTSFTYDAYGTALTTTYPSGVVISNTYDANGYIIKKSASGTGISGVTDLFYNPVTNGEGKYLSYTLGNGKTTTKTYSNVFLQNTSTPGVQNMTFSFQASTGNLLQRSDAINSQSESFTYDNLNRLTGATVNGVVQFAINYDGNVTSSMGNIATKTDAGYYTYKSDKKHAVAYVTQTPVNGQTPVTPAPVSATSTDDQLITYTSFSKAASIEEGSTVYGGGIYLSFDYGADYERVTTFGAVGRNWEMRYFDGNYEEQQGGIHPFRSIHYVNFGDGLRSMLITENNVTSPYYIYTDYLGSILALTDAAGTLVGKQNYDAWGRERNPSNWNQYGISPMTPVWLYRGYTGHEMLRQFSLVNMNGRLYDPILGRMLNPDNYVQEKYNTQNYNRYSYCLNNPLKYTDPTGDFFIIDDFIIGFVRGLFSKGNFFQKIGNAFSTGGQQAWNSAKIWAGLFSGDLKQIISRLTWELPQTLLGLTYSQLSNTVGAVRNVRYFDGATVVRHYRSSPLGITLGSYINGDNSIRPDPSNALFQHEYGHYLQSQASGFLYLPKFAVPSLLSKNKPGSPHSFNPVEQDANTRAIEYFHDRTNGNFTWDFQENPIGRRRDWTMADYHTIEFQEVLYRTRMQIGWKDIFLGWPTLGILNTIENNRTY